MPADIITDGKINLRNFYGVGMIGPADTEDLLPTPANMVLALVMDDWTHCSLWFHDGVLPFAWDMYEDDGVSPARLRRIMPKLKRYVRIEKSACEPGCRCGNVGVMRLDVKTLLDDVFCAAARAIQ